MKAIKIITLSIALVFIGIGSNAQMQVKNPEKKSIHSLGISAGFTIGTGISYKYSPNNFSVQLAILPYKNEEEYMFGTGLSFYYKIVDKDKIDFFIYQGNQFFTQNMKEEVDLEGSSVLYTTPKVQKLIRREFINVGLGFGFEFLIKERVSLNLMGGYGSLENFKIIQPTGEISLFYNF